MRELDIAPIGLIMLKNVLDLHFRADSDPPYEYRILKLAAPDAKLDDHKDDHESYLRHLIREVSAYKRHTYFSALNNSRKRVLEAISKHDKFPPNEFCVGTHRKAFQFMKPSRFSQPGAGFVGSVCILNDPGASPAQDRGHVRAPENSSISGYMKTSQMVDLQAIMLVKLTNNYSAPLSIRG